MNYNTPTAQRLISRLTHTAYITEHRCEVEDNEFVEELIRLSAETILYLVKEANVSSEAYLQRLNVIQEELIAQGRNASLEFNYNTRQIKAATQLLRNRLVDKPTASILAFGTK